MKNIKTSFAALVITTALTGCVPDYPGDYPEEWGNENTYWQGNYVNEPYYSNQYGYEAYQPAYLFGVQSYHHYNGRRFEELNDAELRSNWEHSHGNSHLDWEHARPAARAAYTHVASRGPNGNGHIEGGHGNGGNGGHGGDRR